MAESAHAYVRGSTTKFYEWLEGSGRPELPEGPPVWICGDCHIGNLGPVASADGRVDIQIRDLDQTVIGNPAHDIVRLGLSLAMAARSSDLPGVTTARIVEQVVEGYREALCKSAGGGPALQPAIVGRTLRRAASRSWKHLADERIEGRDPVIPLGRRFWPLTRAERTEVSRLFATEAIRKLACSLRHRDDDCSIRVLDAAYWRKGCSSLGRLRYAVLLSIHDGKGKSVGHCLMDVKEAAVAAAPRTTGRKAPSDQAERVIEGARNLAPHLGQRMLAARLLDRPVFVRELLPQDLKLEIESLTRPEAMEIARFLATVVGRAHARQMTHIDRKVWSSEMSSRAKGSLEAPSWLWNCIVDLVGSHESAYLEHCRRYALMASSD